MILTKIKSCCDHVGQLCLAEFRKRIVATLRTLNLPHLIKSDEFVLFPLLSCLGNFIGRGKERDVLVARIQQDYKINSMISINPINEVRYLSYCNLAEIFVNYEKSIDFFFKQNSIAKNLSNAQQEYYKLCQDPFVKISLKFLVLLSKNIIKPIMKKGNLTTSSAEYLKCMEKILSDIERLKQSTLEEESSSFKFSSEVERQQFLIKGKAILHLLLDCCLYILQKWDSNYIQKTNENGKDRFVICSNRQAERYISYIKKQLDKNSNTRLIVIMSFCKLKHLNFSFDSFPRELKSTLKKQGRDLYNNSITRKKANQDKAFLYFQQLEQKVGKQVELKKSERIKEILVYLEYLGKGDNLTLANMKTILLQWQVQGYYSGSLELRDKKEYLEVFWSAVMNIGFIEFE
jgi:hypothetical protein